MADTTGRPAAPRLWMAGGYHGLRLISPDGLAWRQSALGRDGEVYRGVRFGNGKYVAVGTFGGSNIFAASADGVTWSGSSQDGKYSQYVRTLTFAAGQFYALGGDPGSGGILAQNMFYRSADGEKWTDQIPYSGKRMLRRVAYGSGLFVGVGDYGRRAASKDCVTWTDSPEARAIDTLVDVAFGNGVFVGVGLNSLRMRSTDGVVWTDRLVGEEGEHLNSIVWTGERFVAVGPEVTYFSPDGLRWERRAVRNGPLFMAYGNGLFVGSQWKGKLLASRDAVEWKQVHQAEHHLECLCYSV